MLPLCCFCFVCFACGLFCFLVVLGARARFGAPRFLFLFFRGFPLGGGARGPPPLGLLLAAGFIFLQHLVIGPHHLPPGMEDG